MPSLTQCLLPVVNIPLLDYTIECLDVAKIQEIFIFCQSHHDQVKQHLQ
jgi:translation initiation factor eIF-2B subunit epsilon